LINLIEASSKIKQARYELAKFAKTQGSTAIGSAFKPFFEKYPEAKSVVWVQYTPHFNDGDTCEFGVREPEIHGDDGEDRYCYGEGLTDKELGIGAEDAFDDIWQFCDEDLLQLCFGDGVQVTVTAETVEVEEYDHD